MSRKGENIYKRKDGRWEGRYIRSYDAMHKAQYGYVYGKTYKQVKQKLMDKKIAAHQSVNIPMPLSLSYNELLDDWLCASKINIKESTYARYSHLVRTHIKPHLGNFQTAQLTTGIVEEFVYQQLTDGRLDHRGGLSPKTVADMLVIIKSTLEYAKYKNLEVSCNLSKLTIKKKEKEIRVLTPNEQKLLIDVLMKEMDCSKFGVLLSLYTGIRIGELCALKWENFNLQQSTLNVKKTMQRIQVAEVGALNKTKIIISEPKSKKSIRDIPLPTFLVEIASKFSGDSNAFILSGVPDCYIEPRTMQNRFKAYIAESGIEDVNFHALRHTFATRCIEVGFDIKSLSEILGHTNVNITLNRYVHSSFTLKYNNMNKLKLPL